MGKSRNNQKNKRVSRKRKSRKRKSHKHRAGITQEEHLRELINLKARANNLPTWDYNNEYDPPDFLRYAEIQNSPGNRAKENIWYCLNNCRQYPSSPGCEANCIQDEIDKVHTPRTKAESLVRKNIYKLKKK